MIPLSDRAQEVRERFLLNKMLDWIQRLAISDG